MRNEITQLVQMLLRGKEEKKEREYIPRSHAPAWERKTYKGSPLGMK